jgi:1-deoxy-D-xylulose-5-phosphate reductoisomerase
LHYPDRVPVAVERLDLRAGLALEFAAPDEETFPAIRLARQAGAKGDRAACAMNAANEVAVRAFLAGTLQFPGIFDVVRLAVESADAGCFESYAEVAAVDAAARAQAMEACAAYVATHSTENGVV